MIDTRCRDIGAKIRENILGDLQRAATQAEAAATKLSAEGVARSTEFAEKLKTQAAATDRKMGLLAEKLDKAIDEGGVARIVAAVKTEMLAEMDKKIDAALKSRNGTRR